jgi:hypothetical protein
VPLRADNVNDRDVPILNANIVLEYAEFANIEDDKIVVSTILNFEDKVAKDELNYGHSINVPISPPKRLILYPL